MRVDITCRPMQVDDSVHVARILREGFPDSLHPYLAYCQPGISDYLLEISRHGALFPAHFEHVAIAGDRVVGYAELRTNTSGPSVLTYLAVDRGYRGAGVGRRLLADIVPQCHDVSAVELDVFASNLGARKFYDQFGAVELRHSIWRVRALDDHRCQPFRIVDWHRSAASLSRYGFCQITFEHEGMSVHIGLPSRTVARLYSPPDEIQVDMVRYLAQILPISHCLYIDQDGLAASSSWDTLLVSGRFSFPSNHPAILTQ